MSCLRRKSIFDFQVVAVEKAFNADRAFVKYLEHDNAAKTKRRQQISARFLWTSTKWCRELEEDGESLQ